MLLIGMSTICLRSVGIPACDLRFAVAGGKA